MITRRDQRLGERKARRDIVGRSLELPAVISCRIGVGAAQEGEIALQAEQGGMIRRDVQGIAQQEIAGTGAFCPHGDAHQADARVHAVGRDLQHGLVGAPRPVEIVHARGRPGAQPVQRDLGVLRPAVLRLQLVQELLAPPLLQPQLAERRHQLGGTQTERPRPPQLLFGRGQIAAGQIQPAEHQSDAGVVGLLLQYALQLGDGALGVAPVQMSLCVLDALLRRRLLAAADGEQGEYQARRQGTRQPRAACPWRTGRRP